ncbi:ATP-dependent DNA ligase [Paenibacillus filicis]|uniref:ATP-dependent DNA ligase n=1 Tax=Paenibacillus filicis TaxID=669464 RepID=A0ABU9DIE7_9BACL
MTMIISPMLLESIQEPFSDDAYVFEPKIDGHRLIIRKQGAEVRLWTRHGNECTRQYPELQDVPIEGDVVLDGEVCCTNESGAIDFESVMDRFQLKKRDKIERHARRRPVNYIVWDILFHGGRDLRGLPLVERRTVLESVFIPGTNMSIVPQIDGRGDDLWRAVTARSMEGMVAKRKTSKYVGRRSADWLKLVNYQYADVYLTGYRKDEFGWLAQVEEGGKLRPAGIIELGVTATHRKAFFSHVSALKTGEDSRFVYLEPRLKATVKFRNWTRNGMLRTPSLVQIKSSS